MDRRPRIGKRRLCTLQEEAARLCKLEELLIAVPSVQAGPDLMSCGWGGWVSGASLLRRRATPGTALCRGRRYQEGVDHAPCSEGSRPVRALVSSRALLAAAR